MIHLFDQIRIKNILRVDIRFEQNNHLKDIDQIVSK